MPTAFVDGLRGLASGIRSIPGDIGVRPYSASLITRSWSGSSAGKGTATETVVPLLHGYQNPKVKAVNEHRVSLGIGFEIGDLTVGPVTPVEDVSWTDILQTSMANEQEVIVRLTHLESGVDADYRIVHAARDRTFSILLTVRPVTG